MELSVQRSDDWNHASQPPPASSASSRHLVSSSRSRSIATPTSRAAPSGCSSPMLPEMGITEQIARSTRKSTVLDAKNALKVLAIPDYDEYRILQPYSCRSSTKAKFVGGVDFVTRHNPQEVNDFKKQYSRDVGNLSRQRSILSPPSTNLMMLAPGSTTSSTSLSRGSTTPPMNASVTSLDALKDVWRRTLTPGRKPCWVLTEHGINTLIGPEYRITTRLPLLPPVESPRAPMNSFPQSCRSPLRPDIPVSVSAFTARESSKLGRGVDLSDEKSLAVLSRIAAYSPSSRLPSPPRSPYRMPSAQVSPPNLRHKPMHSSAFFYDERELERNDCSVVSPTASKSPYVELPHFLLSNWKQRDPMDTTMPSPSTRPFAMEVSPPSVRLGVLNAGEVYLFPVRVRNVGSKTERFRVEHMEATCSGHRALIADANYDKETARLAAGLAAILTLTLSFQHQGNISGRLQLATEGVGSSEIEIHGVVR